MLPLFFLPRPKILSPPPWQKPFEQPVIQQQKPQRQHQIIQECVVRRKDDPDLPRCHDAKAHDAEPPRQKHHPHQPQFQRQRSKRRRRMEPVRPMLHVPPDPGWQRTVLVVVIKCREIPPLRIASHDFPHARFEVDAKAFPRQQKPARSRRWARLAPSRTESSWRIKQGKEARFQQHSIRLVRRKILRRAHKREETHKANRQHSARPQIQDQQHGSDHPHPANPRQQVPPARKP